MTRPHAARVAAWVLAAAGAALLVVGVVRLTDDDSGGGSALAPAASVVPGRGGLDSALGAAKPARSPFEGLTETTIEVGPESVRVVIADSDAERQQGLRNRRTLGHYGGMLFVFPTATSVPFTMSTVPVPLDIGFYDEAGRVVDRLRMEPCRGTDAGCPVYRASAPFRYALETFASDLPNGPLASTGAPA